MLTYASAAALTLAANATVLAAPLVSTLQPIAIQLSFALIAAAVAWGAARFHKATGVNIQATALDHLTKAAQAEAGALIAAGDARIATAQIPVGSTVVADIANRLIAALPGVMKDAGVTPDRVATIVAGEIGKLQARMSAPSPTPAPPSLRPAA